MYIIYSWSAEVNSLRKESQHNERRHTKRRLCRFALGFCKNKKKRTETLYQSFSPFVVEHRGVEPLTFWMPFKRATNCAISPWLFYYILKRCTPSTDFYSLFVFFSYARFAIRRNSTVEKGGNRPYAAIRIDRKAHRIKNEKNLPFSTTFVNANLMGR